MGAAIPLMAFRASAGGLPILIGLFIANRWGLVELAAFTVANATVLIAQTIADWGATRALPRDLARATQHRSAVHLLATANAFRLLLVVAMIAIAAIAVGTGHVQRDIASYLLILSPLCVIAVFASNAVSERVVTKKAFNIGIAVIAGLVTFAILGGCAIALHLGARWFAGAFVVGKFVECLFLLAGRWWVTAVGGKGVLATAAALWPFSVQMILAIIYARLSVFTVERMTTRVELGVFSVAVALYSTMLLIPASMALTIFPQLTRFEEAGDHDGVRHAVTRYVMLSAGAVGVGLLVLALLKDLVGRVLKVPPPLMPFVIAFAAVALLSIFSTICGFLLQARGGEHVAARLSVLTVILALVYQIVALRSLGLWGIVAAVCAAEISSVIVFGLALRRGRRGQGADSLMV